MAQTHVRHKAVVIGGSAGSLDVILKIVAALTRPTGAVFIIVVHRKADADSILVDLLTAKTDLTVKEVEDKEQIETETIYLAPPDYHLLLEDAHSFSLDSSEKIHHSRPSIDVTFESAAAVFGKACIGVLLSGANADGADGLKKIKEGGGFTIVQDPASADIDFMPQHAINQMAATEILPATQIASAIDRLLRRDAL